MCAPTLRVSRAGTRLTVHRPLYIRKPSQLVAVRGGQATIGAPNRLFSIFGVIFNVKFVGEFQPKERLCFNVSTDSLDIENNWGSEENLSIPEV